MKVICRYLCATGASLTVCAIAFPTNASQPVAEAFSLLKRYAPVVEPQAPAVSAGDPIGPRALFGYLPQPTKVGGGRLTYHGGPLIQSVKVEAVFWGSGIDSQIQQRIGTYFSAITNGPYFDWLREYDVKGFSINRGSFLGATTLPQQSGQSVSATDVIQALGAAIDAGTLPAIDDNVIYMVYFDNSTQLVMQGSAICDPGAFLAFHGSVQRNNGKLLRFGMMGDCSGGLGTNPFDGATLTSSHELVEAVTDPDNGSGWLDDSLGQQGEIGDLCVNQRSSVAGYLIQREWSNNNGNCIATDPSVPPPPIDAGVAPPDAAPTDAGAAPDAPVSVSDAGANPPSSDEAGLNQVPPPSDGVGAGRGSNSSSGSPSEDAGTSFGSGSSAAPSSASSGCAIGAKPGRGASPEGGTFAAILAFGFAIARRLRPRPSRMVRARLKTSN